MAIDSGNVFPMHCRKSKISPPICGLPSLGGHVRHSQICFCWFTVNDGLWSSWKGQRPRYSCLLSWVSITPCDCITSIISKLSFKSCISELSYSGLLLTEGLFGCCIVVSEADAIRPVLRRLVVVLWCGYAYRVRSIPASIDFARLGIVFDLGAVFLK